MSSKSRILVLLTDAFGGHGGISRFNRDFLGALCSHSKAPKVVAYPRLVKFPITESFPPGLDYEVRGVGGRLRYVRTIAIDMLRDRRFDLVVCGHIHLLPIAWLLSKLAKCPLVLIVHGIDAWTPTRSRLANRLARHVSAFIAVSELTSKRFAEWSGIDPAKGVVVPNCVDLSAFRPGPKNAELLGRYGLEDRTVLLTLGRLPSFERHKGFDEVIEVLPRLAEKIPNVAYLIAGDGEDRMRLEGKVKSLGLADRVVFSGMVAESEKADHYRLADAYVMPSRGEGFGIVLLEAMACGIPVVASKLDGSREALREGLLGELVDPLDPEDIMRGILKALQKPRRVPEELDYFSHASYRQRVHQAFEDCLAISK
ncbi:glycosyltransferase family 4 protein [Methylocaldum gracile]|jgi:glycosyltransferase involved in cell wall biosynthesis|uniref:glycosyltransferase family 4 protein n=1 Tax=Methylocaldum sp. 0917 TaxID=2485163 RepID=UPI00105FAAB4